MNASLDIASMRAGRKARVLAELERRDIGAIVLFNPINIRYASDARNMQVYGLHNPCRYLFLGADGHAVLFEFRNCEHLAQGLATLDEVRPAQPWYFMAAGEAAADRAWRWADEIAGLARRHAGPRTRIAVDRLDPPGAEALAGHGFVWVDGQEVMERARVIKSPLEIAAMREAIAACEEGLRRMHAALRPGITEQRLWSVLHQANAELGGEWIETRLLTSGPRTNPWYQECGQRVIEAGDLVSFDTDLVGRHGYAVDLSRSWLAGDRPASNEQRRLFGLAHEQVHRNIEAIRPGRSFREIAERSFRMPEPLVPRMNRAIAHGIGLCNEYPLIINKEFFGGAYDGVVEPGMVLCVESYVGEPGGREGVKLEEQVVVTETGVEKLSEFPFDERLL